MLSNLQLFYFIQFEYDIYNEQSNKCVQKDWFENVLPFQWLVNKSLLIEYEKSY